jgi:hypothetical protein
MKRLAFLLLASVAVALLSRGAASAQEKAVESRKLPRRFGFSEEGIVRLLAPAPEGSSFEASLEDWVEASFDRSKTKVLLVAVGGNLENIPNSSFVEVGIIDPRQRRLLCKCEFNRGGFSQRDLGPRGLRLQRFLRATDGAFSFQTTTDRLDAGHFEVQEHWFHPTSTSTGGLTCPEIWSFPLFFSNFGNRGGLRNYGCSSIRSEAGGWRRFESIFYSEVATDSKDDPLVDFNEPGRSCRQRVESWVRAGSPVEVRRVERWAFREGRIELQSSRSARVDHGPARVFPFSLPTRDGSFRSAGEGSTISPSGGFQLGHTPDEFEGSELDLAVGDVVVRKISFRGGDAFRANIKAVGWQKDSSRFFAVIQFGHDRALLSFSVEGQNDYWERLLTDDPTRWRDGFILDSVPPLSKRPREHSIRGES